MKRRIGLALFAAATLLVLIVTYGNIQSEHESHALVTAGYGDFTMRNAMATSPCRSGERATAFLAQGRGKPETTGYLCTRGLEATTIRIAPLSEADKRISWD